MHSHDVFVQSAMQFDQTSLETTILVNSAKTALEFNFSKDSNTLALEESDKIRVGIPVGFTVDLE